MAKKPFRAQHLELRHKTYFALLTVPKDVQHLLGKKRFFKTTGTGDLRIAQAKADLFVIKWKAEIANARQRADDPIINSAMELNKMFMSTPRNMVLDVIHEETDRLRIETNDLIADTFEAVALGKSKVLDSYIPEWKKHQLDRGLEQKTVDQMERDIGELTKYIQTTNLVTKTNCDAWINMIAVSDKLSAASVTRIISSARNFFKYLQECRVFQDSMDDPFQVPTAYKRSKKANAKTINKKESWLPFTKVEVEKLHATTLSKGDSELGNLIVIAAYSGARIEEICSMKKDFIDTDEQTFTIVDAKTQAGNRVVPIHPNIKELVSELLTKSNNDYLFGELTENMYGNRSNAIGKRFGRIKKELGFDKRHVFHSIRKTFTTELERAGITENLAADILGHEKPRITYGIYSGGSDLNQKRKAIQKIKFKF